jgi:hypothetical protein
MVLSPYISLPGYVSETEMWQLYEPMVGRFEGAGVGFLVGGGAVGRFVAVGRRVGAGLGFLVGAGLGFLVGAGQSDWTIVASQCWRAFSCAARAVHWPQLSVLYWCSHCTPDEPTVGRLVGLGRGRGRGPMPYPAPPPG